MPFPATPAAGTADPNPLVTVAQYGQVTGDTGFSDQSELDIYLDDALDIFQRRTRRTLLYGQYTERLFLYANGIAYPSATPFDTTKGVTNNSDTPPTNEGVFQGNGIWASWYTPIPSLPLWTGVVPPQTDITYWGGYVGPDSTLAASRLLPASIKRILARICWYAAHPVTPSVGTPMGIKSVSVGGVSVSGDLEFMVDSDAGICSGMRKWRHPHARAFDGQAGV